MEVGEQRVRIVAGEFRGRKLVAPKGTTTRPTTDRVREALMSALGSRLGGFDDIVVLDAFAGSGALGLEALSRGAVRTVFIERDRAAVSALRSNVETLGVGSRSCIVTTDVFSLAKRGVPGGPFSLILLDPPYTLDQTEVTRLLADLASAGSLAPGCVISLEHPTGVEPGWPEGFSAVDVKRYGTIAIDVATYEEGELAT